MKHTDARQTLARTDATLRLTDKPLWEDPEFLAWEAGQVDPIPTTTTHWNGRTTSLYLPGSAHHIWDEVLEVDRNYEDTVSRRPMIALVDDHPEQCGCEVHGASSLVLRGWMTVSEHDYPAPADTTYGPLLLGPEPAWPDP